MTFLFSVLFASSAWSSSPESDDEGGADSPTETPAEGTPPTPSEKDGRPEGVDTLIKSGVFIGEEAKKPVNDSSKSSKVTEQAAEEKKNTDTADNKKAIEPAKRGELVIQFDNDSDYASEKAWLAKNLERYLKASDMIVVAEILDQRPLRSNLGKDIEIDVNISEYLLGSGEKLRSFKVPFNAPYIPGQPETVPPVIVPSYVMLIFIDQYGTVLDGNAMFVIDGKFAWRNKRPNIFLNPRHDRNWDLNAPIEDYTMYDLADIRKQIKTHKDRPWFKRCFFE